MKIKSSVNKHVKKIKSHKFFKGKLIFPVVFALIGLIVVVNAFAGPPTAQFEAEAGSLTSGASAVSDSTASGGSALTFSGGTTSGTCTPGTLMTMAGMTGTHGPCIINSLIPPAKPGVSTVRLIDVPPVPTAGSATSDGVGEAGAFRTRCDFSHMNFDDAVLFPNRQNAAHLHTYFGNSNTNYASTSTSLLNSGNSTCAGGIFNRSAYWVPSMIDMATGRPIAPSDPRNEYTSDLEIYYKKGYQGTGFLDTVPFPNGLHMIAGNPSNQTTEPNPGQPTYTVRTKYWCETSGPTDRTKYQEGKGIPNCPAGNILAMSIDFPQCWRGGDDLTGWRRNADGSFILDANGNRTSDGRSHLRYGTWSSGDNNYTTGCPSTHPIGLPHVEMFVRWLSPAEGTGNWRLSSDNYLNGPGGYSGHADYMFAWDSTAFPAVIQRCYVARQDCKYNLGDGRGLRTIRNQ